MVNMQLEELFDYVEEIHLNNDFDVFEMKPCKHYQNILKKPMQRTVNYFDKYEPNKNNHFLTSPADVPMEWVKYIISFEKQQVYSVADDKLPNAYLMQKKNENQQQRINKPLFQPLQHNSFDKPNNSFIQYGKSGNHMNQIKKEYEKPFAKQSNFVLNSHQEYKPKYQRKEVNRMEQKISCSRSIDKDKFTHFLDRLDDEYKNDFNEFLEYSNPYECFLSIMDPLFIGFGRSYHEEKVLLLKEYLLKNDQVVNSKTEIILDSLMKQFKLNIIHIDTEKVNVHLTMNDQYATILLFNDGTKWYISYNENMNYSGLKSQKLIGLYEN